MRPRRLVNPSTSESKIEAISLGLAIAGVGFGLSEIYERQHYIYAGVAAGVVATLAYWGHQTGKRI